MGGFKIIAIIVNYFNQCNDNWELERLVKRFLTTECDRLSMET